MVHSLKPSPATNAQDPNRVFAFMADNPQSTNMLTHLYPDQGPPASYRLMDGNGVHAFVWVNDKGQRPYVRYHWKSLQGTKNLTANEAATGSSKDFQYMTTDLYEAIRKGNFPKWELSVQTIPEADLDKFAFSAVQALLAAGADPDGKGADLSPLMHAAFVGDTAIALDLVRAGATIDRPTSTGQTPLMFAALFGRHDTYDALARAGAAENAQDLVGNTPKSLKAYANDADAVEHFLRRTSAKVADLAKGIRDR